MTVTHTHTHTRTHTRTHEHTHTHTHTCTHIHRHPTSLLAIIEQDDSEDACGENCLNRLLMIEWYVVFGFVCASPLQGHPSLVARLSSIYSLVARLSSIYSLVAMLSSIYSLVSGLSSA